LNKAVYLCYHRRPLKLVLLISTGKGYVASRFVGSICSIDKRQTTIKSVRNLALQKNTICLWYNNDAVEAAHFHANTFPDSLVGKVFQAPSDFPGGKGGEY